MLTEEILSDHVSGHHFHHKNMGNKFFTTFLLKKNNQGFITQLNFSSNNSMTQGPDKDKLKSDNVYQEFCPTMSAICGYRLFYDDEEIVDRHIEFSCCNISGKIFTSFLIFSRNNQRKRSFKD